MLRSSRACSPTERGEPPPPAAAYFQKNRNSLFYSVIALNLLRPCHHNSEKYIRFVNSVFAQYGKSSSPVLWWLSHAEKYSTALVTQKRRFLLHFLQNTVNKVTAVLLPFNKLRYQQDENISKFFAQASKCLWDIRHTVFSYQQLVFQT
jgi:hypothetical protein